MKRLIIVAWLILSAMYCQLINAQVTELTSDSGIPFYFFEIEDSNQVSIQVGWPTNWATDRSANPATPYLGSQLLLLGGTDQLGPTEVVEKFRDLGSSAVINNKLDTVMGLLVAPKNEIDSAVAIANNVLTKPQFSERWLKRAAEALEQNQKQMNLSPQKLISDAIAFYIFGDEQLANSISLIDTDDIGRVTKEDLFKWHADTFSMNGSMVVLAGGIRPEKAKSVVDALFDGLERSAVFDNTVPITLPAFKNKTIVIHSPEVNTSYMSLIGLLPPTRESGEFEDAIALTLLGQGENSFLFNALRTELAASYSFNAMASNFTRNFRFLQMIGEVETSMLKEARQVVLNIYSEFINQQSFPDAGGVARYYAGNLAGANDNSSVVSNSIMESILDGYSPNRGVRLAEGFGEVTSSSVFTRVNEVFPRTEQILTIILTPDANAFPDACVVTDPVEALSCK